MATSNTLPGQQLGSINDSQPQTIQTPVEPKETDYKQIVDEQHSMLRDANITDPVAAGGPSVQQKGYVEVLGPSLPNVGNNSVDTVAPTPNISLPVDSSLTLTSIDNPIQNITDNKSPDNLNEKEIYKEQLADLLSLAIEKNASDLHIAPNYPPMLRIDGALVSVGSQDLQKKQITMMLTSILAPRNIIELEKHSDVDLSYEHISGNRFRVNIFNTKGDLAAAFRLIPSKIKSISDLNLPQICYELIKIPQGLILFTGPTGSGKSTSIAAMIEEINLNFNKHIVSIEDPIEYVFPKAKSMVNQREIGLDASGWNRALRELLRQDPNVVLVGEMRDYETIAATITVAETGHLVFTTLHTNSASQTIDRIIDVFPDGQQNQIRSQLANVIVAVIAQRLIPVRNGGRKAVFEVMIATPGIKNAIREGKTYQIDNIIQTNADLGMFVLEKSLLQLIKNNDITVEQALEYTSRPDELLSLLNATMK